MQTPSVIGIFCEDIREEKSGQDTLIGILPDNMAVPSFPGVMPKLAVYIRVHLDASSSKPKSTSAKLIGTDGSEIISLPNWDANVITKGFSDAQSSGNPLVGLIWKTIISPFGLAAAGKIVAIVTIDGIDYVASSLSIIALPPSSSSPAAAARG